MRDAGIPIWAEAAFVRAKVRLIMGDTEIILAMEAVAELLLIVDFDRRYFQVGQVEWKAIVRNGKSRRVCTLYPTARGRAKLGVILRKRK